MKIIVVLLNTGQSQMEDHHARCPEQTDCTYMTSLGATECERFLALCRSWACMIGEAPCVSVTYAGSPEGYAQSY